MKRIRQRVKELTGRSRHGAKDVRVLIRDLNPVLRGWGNYFRTGNAAKKFNAIDAYVWSGSSFEWSAKGRHLHAGEAQQWDGDFFEALGLHRLRGTVRYPKPEAHNAAVRETTGKPCAGKPHARFERGPCLSSIRPRDGGR